MDKQYLKYFVGGLPARASYHDIFNFFSVYGRLEKVSFIKNDEKRKKSSGCCFIRFSKIKDLNFGSEGYNVFYKDRYLEIQPSMRRTQLKKLKEYQNDKKVFINKISRDITLFELESILSRFGRIERCLIIERADNYVTSNSTYKVKGPNQNYAYASFSDVLSAQTACNIRIINLPRGRNIEIYRYNPKNEKGNYDKLKRLPFICSKDNIKDTNYIPKFEDQNFLLPVRRRYHELKSSESRHMDHSVSNICIKIRTKVT